MRKCEQIRRLTNYNHNILIKIYIYCMWIKVEGRDRERNACIWALTHITNLNNLIIFRLKCGSFRFNHTFTFWYCTLNIHWDFNAKAKYQVFPLFFGWYTHRDRHTVSGMNSSVAAVFIFIHYLKTYKKKFRLIFDTVVLDVVYFSLNFVWKSKALVYYSISACNVMYRKSMWQIWRSLCELKII